MLRNPCDGNKCLRLLDLRRGSGTAARNRKGNSAGKAPKHRAPDVPTNSATEGYRLDGIRRQARHCVGIIRTGPTERMARQASL